MMIQEGIKDFIILYLALTGSSWCLGLMVQSDEFDFVNWKSRVQRTTSKGQLHHLKVMIPSVIRFSLVLSDYPDTHFTCLTAGSLWRKNK